MAGPFARFQGLRRQRIVGWLLIGLSVLYIVWFIKVRLLTPGDPVETREWVYFVVSFAFIMLGTMNLRLADMRERQEAEERQRRLAAANDDPDAPARPQQSAPPKKKKQ